MSHCHDMKDLLSPLGIYNWNQSFQWAELCGAGAALDDCAAELEEVQREMNLMTAQGQGLELICALLARRPVAESPKQMREALAALLRIGDRSFTFDAIRDNLSGCGIAARLLETGTPGKIAIAFPYAGGIPGDFSEMRPIIEGIIPCHLEIDYQFWYLIWVELEQKITSWRFLESKEFSWRQLEAFVES